MGHDEQLLLTGDCILAILFTQQCATAVTRVSNIVIDTSDLQIAEQPIGQGSSGVVRQGLYKGVHKVAVKELTGVFAKGSQMHGMFRREALSLISCAHKNVLKFYGVCLSPDQNIWIVTKLMQGGSLLDYLSKKKGLPTCEIIKLAKDIAKGMRFLHSKGILHMDLKAANVFLDEGNAVIGDLGIARLVNEKVGDNPQIGTYRWMAPEVSAQAMLDSTAQSSNWFSYKTDVYSYGILLWELLTCQLPFSEYSPVQAAVGVVMHGVRPPIPASTFPPLRCLIQKCWDQNPSNRPDFTQVLEMLRIISLHADRTS
ncbi:hypothetical protein KP509_30G002900 [Ceratopteris richardii]|uniref:Protein kinase domain-containing protein n=1 Tax=Ceratopteris richardii TaxID=49495 RepID=A0A8T2R0M3_CERRI|nr:hypothetical protein KP509_30G002900 [Ceratopteris richardii]